MTDARAALVEQLARKAVKAFPFLTPDIRREIAEFAADSRQAAMERTQEAAKAECKKVMANLNSHPLQLVAMACIAQIEEMPLPDATG